MKCTLALLALAAGVSSHIVMVPNYGALGNGYFVTEIKFSHGTAGYETTKLEITVPGGLSSVKPEAKAGWESTVSTKEVDGEEVPDMITIAAMEGYGVANENLMTFAIQFKVGCTFADAETNTLWNGQYTLWFQTDQYISEIGGELATNHTLNWTGVPTETQAWNDALPRPSPYVFLTSWDSCTDEATGDEGMLLWHGALVASPDAEAAINEAFVVGLVEERVLSEVEARTEAIASLTEMVASQDVGGRAFEEHHEVFLWLGFALALLNTVLVLILLVKLFLMPAPQPERATSEPVNK